MTNDVTWWKQGDGDTSNPNGERSGQETPGDTDAADIVGRTGEEMPEVAHDEMDDLPAEDVEPRGPEGVPVDAPDNDAPALSPLAVSRTHRAEDDRIARRRSPDFSDAQSVPHDTGRRTVDR